MGGAAGAQDGSESAIQGRGAARGKGLAPHRGRQCPSDAPWGHTSCSGEWVLPQILHLSLITSPRRLIY